MKRPDGPVERADRWANRIAWGVVVFAVVYFGGHVIYAYLTH